MRILKKKGYQKTKNLENLYQNKLTDQITQNHFTKQDS
jgi:hypothetical protein